MTTDYEQHKLDEAYSAHMDAAEGKRQRKVEHAATIPLNRIAVINLLVRAHAALRSVDVLPDLPAVAADRVSDAIAAIEEFASERGIAEIDR